MTINRKSIEREELITHIKLAAAFQGEKMPNVKNDIFYQSREDV